SAVSSPQLVRSVGDDGAGVWVLRSHSRRPTGRKQAVFPHESQNSLLPCPYVVVPQAGPNFAVALAMEHASFKHLADLTDEFLVRKLLRTSFVWDPRLLLALANSIVTGSCQRPHGGHPSHPVRLVAGRRKGP